ncbi:Hypothetical protein D9617_3g021040 [Elsinoe fawcettii]|nr:Hypothetical protein D9617_3g021040 [Elsinoe fawcettii]
MTSGMQTAGPPGTVQLLDHKTGGQRDHLHLNPQPSTDPNDPLNWSAPRKWFNLALTLYATALIFAATVIQGVFWRPISEDLDVTFEQLTNSYAVNLVGLATGCIFFIPFAVRYGRRTIYLISNFLLLATVIWSARMKTLADLYATNLIMGLGGAVNETIVQMTIADLFFVHQRGTANGLYLITVIIGNFLSPIGAGYMVSSYGWRLCYWVLTAFSGFLCLIFVVAYEETKYVPILTGSRPPTSPQVQDTITIQTEQSSKAAFGEFAALTSVNTTGSVMIDYTIPKASWKHRLRLVTRTNEDLRELFYRPFIILGTFPHILYAGLQYAFGLCWISVLVNTMSATLPQPPYNFEPSRIGLLSLGPFVGSVLGAIYGGPFADWLILRLARRNRGVYEPEMRLHLLHFPLFIMPAGILLFGISIPRGMSWIVLTFGGGLFGFGLGAFGDTAITLVVDSYRDVFVPFPKITGEAFVGITFLRNAISVAITFALTPWQQSQGLQNFFIVVGVWCFVICLTYIPMLIWGKEIRARKAAMYARFAN